MARIVNFKNLPSFKTSVQNVSKHFRTFSRQNSSLNISLKIYRELFRDRTPFRKYHVFNAKQFLRTWPSSITCLCTQVIHLSKQKINKICFNLYLPTVSNVIKVYKWRQRMNFLQISRGNITWDRGRINKNAIELTRKFFSYTQWENFQNYVEIPSIKAGVLKAHI